MILYIPSPPIYQGVECLATSLLRYILQKKAFSPQLHFAAGAMQSSTSLTWQHSDRVVPFAHARCKASPRRFPKCDVCARRREETPRANRCSACIKTPAHRGKTELLSTLQLIVPCHPRTGKKTRNANFSRLIVNSQPCMQGTSNHEIAAFNFFSHPHTGGNTWGWRFVPRRHARHPCAQGTDKQRAFWQGVWCFSTLSREQTASASPVTTPYPFQPCRRAGNRLSEPSCVLQLLKNPAHSGQTSMHKHFTVWLSLHPDTGGRLDIGAFPNHLNLLNPAQTGERPGFAL